MKYYAAIYKGDAGERPVERGCRATGPLTHAARSEPGPAPCPVATPVPAAHAHVTLPRSSGHLPGGGELTHWETRTSASSGLEVSPAATNKLSPKPLGEPYTPTGRKGQQAQTVISV